MVEVRRAGVGDVDELVRLRRVMLAGMSGREPDSGPWEETAVTTLRERLAGPEPSMAAYVVDRPDESGRLAACAVGVIERRLGGPDNPRGEIGYVFNVATDPTYRRRGCSRAVLTALLDWFRRRDVTRIDLVATPDGAPLYRELGFQDSPSPMLRLTR
ncbi:GNAT family N-acetyltransferase [Micromonospora sp. WMMD882]|uniref:GNAT family N-acetyltransferase n=1 Tax=Micromonospora sp. WMMD882 TaxID=3015151 RepID=UPI00248BA48F|nr:GNAT family N-acetyltransferase [Micromonospora sp. WMMD882]WBB81606.1 GNAT family N-acetyltransferase [Micromonospora sp. WMMD882]